MKYHLRDAAPYALRIVASKIFEFLDTAMAYAIAYWWKINLGGDIKFTGLPLFYRHPAANITIGSKCIFRSAEWSNSIGINRRCFISAARDAHVRIGEHCGFSGTTIAASQSITIGNRVLCGANCTIVDTDRHPLDFVARAKKENAKSSPILIEDDVFLGMNVVVLKGCTIGKGTVVAANSVVEESLPAGILAAGTPARFIRFIDIE